MGITPSIAGRAGVPAHEELVLAAQGLVSENFSRDVASNTLLMVGGVAYGVLVGLRAGESISKVYVQVSGAGTLPTLFKAGIYSKDGATRYAVSADQSSLFASTGVKTVPLTAAWAAPADDAYLVVIVATATTTLPTIIRGLALSVVTLIGSNVSPFATAGSALSDLPAAPLTLSQTTNSPAPFWVGVGA